MKTLRSLLGLALLFSAAALLRAEPVTATPAPAWKLKDLDGKVVSSDQFKGKVVVLDFWATWCPPCRAEIPGYIALQKKYGKDGLVIIGVSCDQDRNAVQTVKNFVVKSAMNYVVLMADDEIQAAFGGMDAIPTTFLIDRDGQLRDRKVGAEPEAVYEQTILKYLK
jgi:thiol-disulfide isomerase/thioredoxin